MKFSHLAALCSLLAIWASLSGCVSTKSTTPTDDGLSSVTAIDQPPKTLAILPFENNSVTDPDQYEPLTKGLAAMLITDLNMDGSELKIIERTMIQSLLKEVALSQSGSVDKATAVRVGKMLGAQAISFGSFMVLGDNVRMDVRIVKVETSELIMAESITGSVGNFMGLEKRLAGKIAKTLRVALTPEKLVSASSIDAALYFSKGLEAFDSGNKSKARELFAKSIALDPSYQKQVDSLEGF